MEARAVSKYLRISPQKTRLVIDLIRGKGANNSMQILESMNKRAAFVVNKVLASAVANARQKELDIEKLWIKIARVDGGPAYKRYMPRAMGRATMIKRPTSHITLILSDEKESPRVIKEEEARGVAEVKKKKEPLISKIRKKKAKKGEKAKKVKKKQKK